MSADVFRNFGYRRYRVIGWCVIGISLLFLGVDAMQIASGHPDSIPFFVQRILLTICGVTLLVLVRRRERQRLEVGDWAPLLLAVVWNTCEFTSRMIQGLVLKTPATLAAQLAPLVLLTVVPILGLRESRRSVWLTVYSLSLFMTMERVSGSPWILLLVQLLAAAFGVGLARLFSHYHAELEAASRACRNLRQEVDAIQFEVQTLRERCRYAGACADKVNSPVLVVENCLELLAQERGEQACEDKEPWERLNSGVASLKAFSAWLSDVREINSHRAGESKDLFETTSLLSGHGQSGR